jgi:hypothetical protein
MRSTRDISLKLGIHDVQPHILHDFYFILLHKEQHRGNVAMKTGRLGVIVLFRLMIIDIRYPSFYEEDQKHWWGIGGSPWTNRESISVDI